MTTSATLFQANALSDNPRDWKGEIGLMNSQSTSVVFTLETLTNWLKTLQIEVDANLSEFKNLPKFAQLGKMTAGSPPEPGEHRGTPTGGRLELYSDRTTHLANSSSRITDTGLSERVRGFYDGTHAQSTAFVTCARVRPAGDHASRSTANLSSAGDRTSRSSTSQFKQATARHHGLADRRLHPYETRATTYR